MHSATLSGVVAEHIDAVNAMDTDRIVDTFAADAYVNDNRREFVGLDAIRRWVDRELVGDKVTIHYKMTATSVEVKTAAKAAAPAATK